MFGIWTPRNGAGSHSTSITAKGSLWSSGYTQSNTSVQGRGYFEGDGGPHGSVADGAYRGKTITGLFHYTVVNYLYLVFNTTVTNADSFFYSIEISGGPDGGSTWLRSAGTPVSIEGHSGWRWADGAPIALNTTGSQNITLNWR